MPNGKIRFYEKGSMETNVEFDIVGTFNIEDNLNDTPSNMKVKFVTTNTYREELEVNTIAYHQDTDSWWVIKKDESTYLQTGEYEHETELVELLEFYSYKHLPNCAFAPNTYTLEQMLNRLFFDIAGLSLNHVVLYPAFLDQNKIMPFFSFENYTVANAIKNIARAINAVPKMYYDILGGDFTLTFINRSGLDTAIPSGNLNDLFPTAYEKNTNSSDQYVTRSISNITNAKSSILTIAPKQGGFKTITLNSLEYDKDNNAVYLPSKIEKIEFIRLYAVVDFIVRDKQPSPNEFVLYTGYYVDKEFWATMIESKRTLLKGTYLFTDADVDDMIDNLPDPITAQQINLNDPIDKNTTGLALPFFEDKLTIKSKFDFDTTDISSNTDVKNRTCHWLPFTNELIMAKTFRYGLLSGGFPSGEEVNGYFRLKSTAVNDTHLKLKGRTSGIFNSRIPTDEVLIQVGYYPIADIKVSVDNDNEAQDEKFFNQSGKIIDALSVSKLITAHTNDSVEGIKLRNARYGSPDYDFSDILPLGQIVRDSNKLYVVSQRSIDGLVNNANEYYNVIYTLTNNRIGRSENIVADSSVISYKTPDDNLVFRTQLYKDYIELSLVSTTNQPPFLALNKLLVFSDNLAGTNFDYTVLVRSKFGSTPTVIRYVQNPTIFDLHKAKLMNINWQDNNVLGYRLDSTGSDYVQTPIVYTDNLGKAKDFELLFLNTTDLENAQTYYNANYTPNLIIPFGDLTDVNSDFYEVTIKNVAREYYSIIIPEQTYNKDPFEIPVFEYMIQGNDDYSANGNIVVGNDLFSTFTGDIKYHYTINNTTRFTSENASSLYVAPSGDTDKRVTFTRSGSSNQILDLDIYSTFSGTRNTSLIKNIGIYAKVGSSVKFLFAINDYVESGSNDKDNIRVFINNWKI
jgi:hypothetical protein